MYIIINLSYNLIPLLLFVGFLSLFHAQTYPDSLLHSLFPRQTCPNACQQWTPCCSGGYCRKDPLAGCLISEGCDPTKSYNGHCIPLPTCKSFRDDFNATTSLINKSQFTHPDQSHFWREYNQADNAYVENGNLVLELKWDDNGKEGKGGGQGATIPSVRFAQYGRFSARIKAASGVGVVSSFISKTSVYDTFGDELDFELLGSKPSEVQTNYYVNGKVDYTRASLHTLPHKQTSDTDYHIYTIDWQPDITRFLVDGNEVRSLKRDDSQGEYPSQVMRIWFSVWDAGCNMPDGTKMWAGGETDWCKDSSKRNIVRKMYVDWVEVQCATEDTRASDAYTMKIASPNTSSDPKSSANPTRDNNNNRPIGAPIGDAHDGIRTHHGNPVNTGGNIGVLMDDALPSLNMVITMMIVLCLVMISSIISLMI